MKQQLWAVALIALIADVVIGVRGRRSYAAALGDGQYWDIQDTSLWAGRRRHCHGRPIEPLRWLRLLQFSVRRPDNSLLSRNMSLHGFGLALDGGERFNSIMPMFCDGIVVAGRDLLAPKDKNYLRYLDSFTNMADEDGS